ncbi:MAG TPA: 2-phosphosulfolactate phosphatase [Negativicutes bacterium]
MNIEICFTPQEYRAECFMGYTAVVIDVFRATTSIATAFYHGCHAIIPVETVEQAFAQKEAVYPEAILAGERQGLLIPGFQLGNSPQEYTCEKVKGRIIIMTTTNGTVALHKTLETPQVYTVGFVNAMAVCLKLQSENKNVVILCAGTEGSFSLEDTLCAGLIADRLSSDAVLTDKAMAVQGMYRGFRLNMLKRVAQSSHARYLAQIGFTQDIKLCMEQDIFAVTPVFCKGILTV